MPLSDLHFDAEYRTSEREPVEYFYKPCLREAKTYERASGYFKSTVFSLISSEIAEFALNGGKMKIVCSPQLSEDDLATIIQSTTDPATERCISRLADEIEELIADETLKVPRTILATLLRFEVIEIRVAVPSQGNGIFHEKLGVLSDERNTVTFKGSINETFSGWNQLGNFESIDVYCDWKDKSDRDRVNAHSSYFKRLWRNEVQGVLVLDVPAALREDLVRHSLPNLQGLGDLVPDNTGNERGRNELKRNPYEHQSLAIESWKKNNRRGILKHATGSGKTFTAILIMKEFLAAGHPVIVLVPSKLLQKQWRDELRSEFPEAALLLIGGIGKGAALKGKIGPMTNPSDTFGQRIIISIVNSAASDWFLDSVSQSESLLIVADEVHQLGSKQFSKFFAIDAGARLGLSATPERFGDPDGTRVVFDYFGGIVPPEYTLVDAIRDKHLVQYEYYPLPVNLTADEAEKWKEETLKIQREYARSKRDSDGNALQSEKLRMLIIQRSRIAKKALNKISLCLRVISENYKDGQRWLIYCEDQYQLSEIVTVLSNEGYKPVEYHSAMAQDRDASLKWFVDFGGILVSIKCLDEGVDIPTISHALILASSQNPRQFIQRRGRVLRKATGKHLASIYDAIVVPVDIQNEPEQTALLEAELVRAIEFSKTAINSHAGSVLRQIGIRNDIDLASLSMSGIEEE